MKTGILKKAWKTIESTVTCLRYPFLYPRNRFTGLHYNNWRLIEYRKGHYKKAVAFCNIKIVHEKDLPESLSPSISTIDGHLIEAKVSKDDVLVLTVDGAKRKKANIHDYSEGIETPSFHGLKQDMNGFTAYFSCNTANKNKPSFHFLTVVVDRWEYLKVKTVGFTNDYILQAVHCLTSYTEWDALKSYKGWYKAFGKQLLREIDAQLRKDGMRRKWRITDIKEKYGSLRIYCNYGTKDLYAILSKYEEQSYHTCIECGKTAKYLTGGYIVPVCEDHFDLSKEIPYAVAGEDGAWKYDERS